MGTFDKVKAIFSRSQYSVCNTSDCFAANDLTLSRWSLDKRWALDCICRRSSATFWWRQPKPVMFIFEDCLKSLLALRYSNTPQCLHSRRMHDRNSIIIGVDCSWHVLLLTAALFYGQISYLTHQRVGILHTPLRTDSRSDMLLLKESIGLSLAENKVKLHSGFLFSLFLPDKFIYTQAVFTRNAVSIIEVWSVMFIVIMKEYWHEISTALKLFTSPVHE